MLHRSHGGLSAAPGQIVGGPPLGSLPQPRLADLDEVEPPAQPEGDQVPHVLDSFGLLPQERSTDMAGEAADQLVVLAAGLHRNVFDGFRLHEAQFPADLAERGNAGLRPFSGPLLQPVQNLHDHRPRDAMQADLPRIFDRRFKPPPPPFVEPGVAAALIHQPFVVGAAVAPVSAITRTGLNLAPLAS